MSRASCLQIVVDLSRNQADAAAIDRYYSELAFEYAQRGIITDFVGVQCAARTSEYTYPTGAVRAFGFLYDGDWIDMTTLRALQSVTSYWRDRFGRPQAATTESEDAQRFQLFPAPDVDGEPTFGPGDLLGAELPANDVLLMTGAQRADLPEYFDLPLAYEVLAREYTRESNHRDLAFATVCRDLAQLFSVMVG